jgi:hypothetical protein
MQIIPFKVLFTFEAYIFQHSSQKLFAFKKISFSFRDVNAVN